MDDEQQRRITPPAEEPPPPPPPPASPGMTMWVEPDDDADGPPPPPFVRRRRRRRNAAIVVAVLIIAGVPLVLGVIGNADRLGRDGGAPSAGADDGSGAQPDAPGRDGGRDGDRAPDAGSDDTWLEHPAPAELEGVDAVYAELLSDIDRSELAMIGFQDALSEAFGNAGLSDGDELTGTIRDAAAEGQQGLADVRERLVAPLDDPGADAVREAYLLHLDSWASYMEAVAEDPGLLAAEDRTRAYLLSINVTADRFARTLEDRLPDDVDSQVRRFADGILDRGFRGFGEANV